jgi:uncharacterized SAM-binding protein YcdF (DUF218 family)
MLFALSKIFTYLLLPPGLFIVMGVLATVLLLFGRRRSGLVLLVSMVCCLFLLSLAPVRDLLIMPLENRYAAYTPTDAAAAQAIVVLGGGVVGSSPAENGASTPSADSLTRLVHAARIHQQTDLPIVISGGSVFKTGSQSVAMAAVKVLKDLGIAESKIIVEAESRNTWENAAEVRALIAPRSVILVTTASHMPRSVWSFRKNGVDCIPAPTDYRPDRLPYRARDLLPTAKALLDSSFALHEYVGLLYYAVRY